MQQFHPISFPDGFDRFYREGALVVRWPWRFWRGLYWCVLALGWQWVMTRWVWVALQEELWRSALLGGGYWLAGLIVGYRGLAEALNHSELTIGPTQLSLRFKPLPWFGQRSLALTRCGAVVLQERMLPTPKRKRPALVYDLWISDARHPQRCLLWLGTFRQRAEAEALQTLIQQQLPPSARSQPPAPR